MVFFIKEVWNFIKRHRYGLLALIIALVYFGWIWEW